MKTSPFPLVLLAGALPLHGLPAMAQETDPFDLGLVILSGGLTPIAAVNLQRSFTTIDAEEIAQKGHATVLDVLRTVPGFQPSTGGLNAFRIRGAEADHALVLIDGIEVGLGSSGTFELGNLAVGDIERIEVLRGPQSAAFGANAASGVINIVTRGAPDTPGSSARIGVELADRGGRNIGATVATRTDRGFLSLSFAHKETGRYDIANDDGDEDSDSVTAITFKGAYDVTDTLTLGVTLRDQSRRFEYDANASGLTPDDDKGDYVIDGDGEFDEQSLSGEVYALLESFDGRLQHRLSYSALDQEFTQEQTVPSVSTNETENTREKWAYRATFGIDGAVENADQILSLLLEEERETYTLDFLSIGMFGPFTAEADEERFTTSTALEYRGSFANGLDVQIGGRFDRYSDFTDSFSWNGAIGYALTPDTTLRVSGGKGVVAPTMTDQFGAFSDNFQGNPDLTPEILLGWDVGIDHVFAGGAANVSLTYFEQRIEDRISPTFNFPDPDSVVNEDGTSHQHGIEVAADYQATETLSFDLAYTYTHATDAEGDLTLRVPAHVLNLGARLVTFGGKGDVWAQVNRVAGITDIDFRFPTFPGPATTTELAPYTLVNIGASYNFLDNAALYGRIENLTQETYEEQWGYMRDDRVFAFGIRASF